MVLAMKKSCDLWQNTYHESLPVILQMFNQEVLPRMNENDFALLENKLLTITDEGNIPSLFRSVLFG
jgi:hypothetical protein